jgi:cytochrome c peroxidase
MFVRLRGHALIFAVILAVPISAQVPLTPLEQLGKELFFDNISNPAKSMSCASCHSPSAGWVGAVGGSNQHGGVYRGAAPTRFGNRKPPTAAYSTYTPVFNYIEADSEFEGGVFWDGRATGAKLGNPAADQALGPFLNPVEQNMPSAKAVCEHVARSKYAKLFVQVWGTLDCSDAGYEQSYGWIGKSIAAYEGSEEVSPFSSKFDAYWDICRAAYSAEECGLPEAGQKAVLDPTGIFSAKEFAGFIEFAEYCSDCHVSHIDGVNGAKKPLFTDFRFHNVGVPKNPENPFYRMDKVLLDNNLPINPMGAAWVDYGLGGFLRSLSGSQSALEQQWSALASVNDGKFRTPTVRNVDARPGFGFPKAYMHNGVFKSLEQVVSFYNTRNVKPWPAPEVSQNLNTELFTGKPIGDFELDADAEAAVVEFLKTLTDGWKPKKK